MTAAPPPEPAALGVVPRLEISIVKLFASTIADMGNVPAIVAPLNAAAPVV